MKRTGLIIAVLAVAACAELGRQPGAPSEKFRFDVRAVDEYGYTGPVGSKRPLSYQFCVPNTPGDRATVQQIDPSARFLSGVPGRPGCTEDRILAIGSTDQPNWRRVLDAIADLPYVDVIRLTKFE
ncbi:MAG: hypothetical protein KIT73_02130 [Burkholderiales bacterium]|nr:hypothetical protein [Burkholderiales bacterium]